MPEFCLLRRMSWVEINVQVDAVLPLPIEIFSKMLGSISFQDFTPKYQSC